MKNRFYTVLSNKPFLFLWLSEVVSQIAMNMTNFMLLIVAFDLTGSNTAVSGIVLSFTIPAIIFGVLAGVYVDRRNKRNILFGTNLVRAVLLFFLAFVHRNLGGLYFLSFLIAIATQFFIPAETPLIPNLVAADDLLSANALFSMGVYGSIFIAYALSGPFLILLGRRNAFLTLGIFFLIASFLISAIKNGKTKISQKTNSSLSLTGEIKELFQIIKKTSAIYHSVFLLILSQILILVLAVIGPGYARHILHIPVDAFPLLFVTPATLGMIVGALTLGNFFSNHSRDKIATWGVFLAGITLLLFPYGSNVASKEIVYDINLYLPHILRINILHIMVVLAFVFGLANALIFVPSNTILQEETSDDLRGKVYGALNGLVGLFSLFPIILVGSFADVFGVASVLTGIGIIILCIGVSRILLRR